MAGQFTLRRIELEMDLSPSLPKTNADRIQIQQVMMNLIQNGLEDTDSAREQPGALQLRTHLEAENIIVEVCDQGVGVENPEQIFEPFFTTKESGMGIGLAISRSIIEAHQGVLRALPNHPTGTRFIFTLPVFRDNLS